MDSVRNWEWSLEEKKKFNEAIRDINLEGPECVEELIRRFPEKPVYQIRDQYVNFFVEKLSTENVCYDAKLDSLCIEALESENFGLLVGEAEEGATMPPSICEDVAESSRKRKNTEAGGEIGDALEEATRKKSSKGQPWTIEEHGLFLRGLQKFGRGKWRMISWEFVKTKTPIQVASHAQKYFERLKAPSNKRRGSIHDIRLVDNSVVFNPDSATSNRNYSLFTDNRYATPGADQFANSYNENSNNNYWQFASSNNAIPAENYGHCSNSNVTPRNWQFASSSNIVLNRSYGRFATNLPQDGIFDPNGSNQSIFPESDMSFGGQQQNILPFYQYPWVFKI